MPSTLDNASPADTHPVADKAQLPRSEPLAAAAASPAATPAQEKAQPPATAAPQVAPTPDSTVPPAGHGQGAAAQTKASTPKAARARGTGTGTPSKRELLEAEEQEGTGRHALHRAPMCSHRQLLRSSFNLVDENNLRAAVTCVPPPAPSHGLQRRPAKLRESSSRDASTPSSSHSDPAALGAPSSAGDKGGAHSSDDSGGAHRPRSSSQGGHSKLVGGAAMDGAIPIPKTGTGYPLNPHPLVNKAPGPSTMEPFCDVREDLIAEMLLHDAERLANPQNVMNRVVYDCIEPNPNKGDGGEAPPPGHLPEYYTLHSPNDTTLLFESRFEGGNLRRAIQVYEFEYDIILRPDINTRGHTQWYFFRIRNMRPGRKYKFNLINLVKPDSLYNYGMLPLVYSTKETELPGAVGWQRRGENVCYYQNHIKRRQGSYYTMSFVLDCKYANDTIYTAYCYPYSFTDLQVYLHELETDPKRRIRVKRRVLCQTLAGNNCDILTITSFGCDPEAMKARKGVVISARVHPGESNASWMMKGFVDYLTGPSLDAKILRDNFVFKIIPMLNPDGVINGNYRCSLAGTDLNRCWDDPSKKLHPTIFNTKAMIRKFMEEREVVMFCDLHGHSRKKNIFMYGCDQPETSEHRLRERIFPRLLERNSDVFAFGDCNFKVQKSKEGAGRVVVARELGLLYSYTMEASFCGANFGPCEGYQFNANDLERMGHFFCDTILDFCDPDQSKVNEIRAELESMYPAKRKVKQSDEDSGDTDSDDDQVSDSGSESGEDAAAGANGGAKKEKKSKKKKKKGKDKDKGSSDSGRGGRGSGKSSKKASDSGSGSGGRLGERAFRDALNKPVSRDAGRSKRSGGARSLAKKRGGSGMPRLG